MFLEVYIYSTVEVRFEVTKSTCFYKLAFLTNLGISEIRESEYFTGVQNQLFIKKLQNCSSYETIVSNAVSLALPEETECVLPNEYTPRGRNCRAKFW